MTSAAKSGKLYALTPLSIEPQIEPKNSILRVMPPGCTPIILVSFGFVLSDFAAWKNPGTVAAPGFCRKLSVWRTGGRDEPL